MQKYKSIFKESLNDMVDSEREAKQIVDISNLQWSKSFLSNWDSAQSKCSGGWRLPNIQELYTAYVQNVKGFKPFYYWSSSTYAPDTNVGWCVSFGDKNVSFKFKPNYYNYKTNLYYVRCVKEK